MNTYVRDNLKSTQEWDYAQLTAGVSTTATTEGTAASVITGNSVSYDGTEVNIEFFAPVIDNPSSGGFVYLLLMEDSTVLDRVPFQAPGASVSLPVFAVCFRTPSSHRTLTR